MSSLPPAIESKAYLRRRAWLVAGLLVVATMVAYHNSFSVPFFFDDRPAIERNESIRHLWPLSIPLSPPITGAGVAGRPLTNLTLAFNYAASGLNVWSYHWLNLAIHLLGGLTLWSLLRHTLRSPFLRGRFDQSVEWAAGGAALLWLVHPLQTESVVCVVQRNELLAGLFYLLTLHCFIRSTWQARRSWSRHPS